MSANLGRVIADRYELLEPLGQGAMGSVYLARQDGMERKVALKLLHAEFDNDPEITARFEKEMRISASIEHPNTVRVYDHGQTAQDELYLVMELLDGHALHAVLAGEGKLTPARTVHIAKQIASALAAAHAEGVIHRDLKPENVILLNRYDRTDWVKVLDFGLARLAEESEDARLTAHGDRVGTPHYMAPEYINGEDVDHRGDLYALGVLLYEMVTGEPPFIGDPYEVLHLHLSQEPVPPASSVAMPEWLDDLILQLLSKDPASRPQTALEVSALLDRPVELPTPPTSIGMRGMVMAGFAGVVALMVVMALLLTTTLVLVFAGMF